ncbi:MAG: HDOD domain-containing protein [Desulfobacterales bacterium]|nr:HDOD domain-containing protein [Desulfobacterales bacterium]
MRPTSAPLFNRIETSYIPVLPHILLKLIDACNRQETTIKDISQIINKDSSLSSKVLRMVNSAYYGLPNRVTSIEYALLLVGTDAIKNIAISASVFQVFGAANGGGVFNLKLFWEHGLMCATLARMIAKKISYSSDDEAFLSGLLHDIGKLVLWVNFRKEYSDILRSSNNKSDLLLAAETRLGATHCEVGAHMIRRWHLQSFMADAVFYHHEPVRRILDAMPLVKIVFVANTLCTDAVGQDEAKLQIAQEVFGFTPSEVEDLILQAEQEVRQVAESLDIEIDAAQLQHVPVSDKDREKKKDLAREVRDISLLQGTLQNLLEAHGQESIFGVIKQGLQVLFGLDRILFLLYDDQRDALVGKGGREPIRDPLIKELIIPLQVENSLLIQSLRQRVPLDSFGHLKRVDLAIIDDQIIRLTEKDGILCLPMIAHKQILGVIILGLEQARVPRLCKQINLLTMFAGQSALALHADNVRQAQSRLVQSERLAASSAVARKVVHEVSNPLGIIKNYIKILGLKLSDGDPAQDGLRIINEELDRLALIIRELSDFSEPEVKQIEPVDINAVLSDLVKITWESFMLDSKINVHLGLEPLPTIFAEKNMLKQVFINLIKNAVEAMPGGGNVYLGTRRISNKFEGELEHETRGAQEHVEITVRDDGPGIPDSIKSRLFEPFISSKGGEHAGLGLSIAYNIIKELQGTITCESSEKTGTAFRIVLPARKSGSLTRGGGDGLQTQDPDS